ncbi:hypothetical protein HNR19_003115 [Nocardioides thalensis]|uniref:Uncharacterized protein n=1 Tax=Nocardioides thalensis TaxID=1914755 RepID=A0A853C578_9ACTN|nr:hypothetical protein [Nocardioides thalensis]NYJ02417.1 hypothetical protein [Nocardioides thalensis]
MFSNARPLVRLLLGALALGLAAVLLVPASAQADTGSLKDKKGDAAKSIDITAVRFNNGTKTISGKFSVNDLGKSGIFTAVWLPPDLDGNYYGVALMKKSGKFKAVLSKITSTGGKVVKCKGVKGNWSTKASAVTFSVPQKCLGTVPKSWIFGGGSTSVTGKQADNVDGTVEISRG